VKDQINWLYHVRRVQVTIQTFTLAPSILCGTRPLCLIQEREQAARGIGFRAISLKNV
jgi:hypothetical protein